MDVLVFGTVAVIVVGLLLRQEVGRRRLKDAPIIEVPISRRSLIATAAIAGPTVLLGGLSLMMVSIESWSQALVFAVLTAAGGVLLWFTRKPLGVVRCDGTRHVLNFSEAPGTKQFDLRQPFKVGTRVFIPLVGARVRGGPSMIVTVEQGDTSLTFWFPWTLREFGAPVGGTTSEALPPLRLDWRGALIVERLRTLETARWPAVNAGAEVSRVD